MASDAPAELLGASDSVSGSTAARSRAAAARGALEGAVEADASPGHGVAASASEGHDALNQDSHSPDNAPSGHPAAPDAPEKSKALAGELSAAWTNGAAAVGGALALGGAPAAIAAALQAGNGICGPNLFAQSELLFGCALAGSVALVVYASLWASTRCLVVEEAMLAAIGEDAEPAGRALSCRKHALSSFGIVVCGGVGALGAVVLLVLHPLLWKCDLAVVVPMAVASAAGIAVAVWTAFTLIGERVLKQEAAEREAMGLAAERQRLLKPTWSSRGRPDLTAGLAVEESQP